VAGPQVKQAPYFQVVIKPRHDKSIRDGPGHVEAQSWRCLETCEVKREGMDLQCWVQAS